MRRHAYEAIGCLAITVLSACASASKDAQAPALAPLSIEAMAASPTSESASLRTVSVSREAAFFTENTGTQREEPKQAPPPPPPGSAPVPQAPATSPGDPAVRSTKGEVTSVRAPLLIYTAQLTMAVFEVNVSLGRVEELARDVGGFLARRDDQSITIRVPVERFDEVVKQIERAGDMLSRNIVAEDVTEQFRDLEVQLKGARAVQERLIQLLAKATKVEESVMIERELSRITGEIDRIEGRMKYLRDRASYSTITVTFHIKGKEAVSQVPFHLPGPWLQNLGLGRLLNL